MVLGRWPALLFALALFGLALWPRWVTRDVFMTSDEDSWMRRAGGFAYGMSHSLPADYQNGHPGVLTMELAILGRAPAAPSASPTRSPALAWSPACPASSTAWSRRVAPSC